MNKNMKTYMKTNLIILPAAISLIFNFYRQK